jgi:hypothetical protein
MKAKEIGIAALFIISSCWSVLQCAQKGSKIAQSTVAAVTPSSKVHMQQSSAKKPYSLAEQRNAVKNLSFEQAQKEYKNLLKKYGSKILSMPQETIGELTTIYKEQLSPLQNAEPKMYKNPIDWYRKRQLSSHIANVNKLTALAERLPKNISATVSETVRLPEEVVRQRELNKQIKNDFLREKYKFILKSKDPVQELKNLYEKKTAQLNASFVNKPISLISEIAEINYLKNLLSEQQQ